MDEIAYFTPPASTLNAAPSPPVPPSLELLNKLKQKSHTSIFARRTVTLPFAKDENNGTRAATLLFVD
jgi:hypothetical protein